jgi:protocatechuate 3,4-dioxygenase beta subunit
MCQHEPIYRANNFLCAPQVVTLGRSEAETIFSMAPALTPVQRPGPFYFPSHRRTVLAEDSAGAPFALTLVVKDADGHPIPAAVVALWHADERGVYSGFVTHPDGWDAIGFDETGKDFVGLELVKFSSDVKQYSAADISSPYIS